MHVRTPSVLSLPSGARRELSDYMTGKGLNLENVLIDIKSANPSVFSSIKNPYFYGEVSISRTARYFPATLIFKHFIILSSIFLFLYWKNNLNLFNELKNNNILNNFSKNFYYFGVLSCLFLILHAAFLGIDF